MKPEITYEYRTHASRVFPEVTGLYFYPSGYQDFIP